MGSGCNNMRRARIDAKQGSVRDRASSADHVIIENDHFSGDIAEETAGAIIERLLGRRADPAAVASAVAAAKTN